MRLPLGLRAAAGAVSGGGWNIANAVYNGSPINFFYVGFQDTQPDGLFFRPNGTKVYITGGPTDSVHEYNLSTAWDLGTVSFVQSFSVAAQETNPNQLFFKDDGTKMYMGGNVSDSIHEYNLSTAWNISTASFVQSFSVAAQDANPHDLFFRSDGTKMYFVGLANDRVYEYNLSTAWNISTASFVQSFSVAGQETLPLGLSFKSDGLKMYVTGGNNSIYEYNLSTAWNVSTASYLQAFSIAATGGSNSISFKPDGTEMYTVTSSPSPAMYVYDLSTAWNVSTASFVPPSTNYFSIAAQETNPNALFFKTDGAKMYVVGSLSDAVHEYNLSTAWNVSTASFVQSFSVAAQETQPYGLFFRPDGTKMYVVGFTNRTVYEYNLSTAWNVSTASFVQSFSVAAQDTLPAGLFFRSDGTKMYFVGLANDRVYEYNLSTAWNISTASFVQSFSVAAQDTNPFGLFFKPDGTKMYITGASADRVYEYNLSTAWNISTASFVQSFSVAGQETNPLSLSFKDDGKKLYIAGATADAIWSYDL